MGGLTSAVHWWEESQLRVLVLTSMVVQVLLLIFSSFRRYTIHGWMRSITWLAYLAGDAVAIYALATLFNRHNQGAQGGGSSSSTLQVMWAPVLLIHLGGHDGITAYNIEDNELWGRHLITAMSQVTVAIYAFCKSWPLGPPSSSNKRLLQAAILLFIPGVVKCFAKPWALKSASIYSLVSSSRVATARKIEDEDLYPLQEYVKLAKEFVDDQEHGNENVVDDDVAVPAAASVENGGHSPSQDCFSILLAIHRYRQKKRKRLQLLGKLLDEEGTRTSPPSGEEKGHYSLSQGQGRQDGFCAQLFQQVRQLSIENDEIRKRLLVLVEASDKLFVDLSSPYPLRLRMLKYFWDVSQDKAYGYVQGGLVAAFHLLYTKLKTAGFATETEMASEFNLCASLKIICRTLILLSRWVLPMVSIGLFHFHWSHSEEAHHDIIDVSITYVIFFCTAVLELFSFYPIFLGDMASSGDVYSNQEQMVKWTETVAQYSLIGYFSSNKKHSKWICIAGIFGCKDFVDQRILCMEPCSSSATISRLVLGYLKDGWKKQIHNVPSYHRFNDHTTHWPVLLGYLEGHHLCLSSMRKRPLDESVLLWHIATDICFFWIPTVSKHRCHFAEVQTSWKACLLEFLGFSTSRTNEQRQHQCRQELTPCRAVLCRQMSNYMAYLLFVNPEMLLPGTRRDLFTDAYDGLNHILKEMDMDEKPMNVKEDESDLQHRVIAAMRKRDTSKKASEPCSGEEPNKVSPPTEEEGPSSSEEKSKKKKKGGRSKEKLIDDAWALAQKLLENKDDEKMWELIQHVWVEMLCYSASRCRGYLHAKALGEGGEFLSYVWLTLFHMGMETFTDKLQREEPQPPSVPHQGNDDNGNAPPPSAAPPSTCFKVSTGITTPSTFELHASASAAPSTSEICCVAEDDMV